MSEHDGTYTSFMVADTLMRNGHWDAVISLYDTITKKKSYGGHSENSVQFNLDWLLPLRWIKRAGDLDQVPRIEEYKQILCERIERIMTDQGREDKIEAMLRNLR